MIISKKYNFIFIRTTKVASSSFNAAYVFFKDKKDIISSNQNEYKLFNFFNFIKEFVKNEKRRKQFFKRLFKKSFFNTFISMFSSLGPHPSAKRIKKYLEYDNNLLFKNFTKITIVRNPWSKFLSFYLYKNNINSLLDFDKNKFNFYVLDYLKNYNPKIFYFIEDEEIIDFYIRFENFENDIKQLETFKILPKGFFEKFSNQNKKINKISKKINIKELYNDLHELNKKIRTVCKFEINKFNYKQP